ncbi:hypothetical protein O3P69_000470 [Scylla paramamosain]|uniref:Uncharacterized protein n=1 Tax=Scylla paramamosain TaxID=85552 RepID=A0AAW0UTC0_SCYPA
MVHDIPPSSPAPPPATPRGRQCVAPRAPTAARGGQERGLPLPGVEGRETGGPVSHVKCLLTVIRRRCRRLLHLLFLADTNNLGSAAARLSQDAGPPGTSRHALALARSSSRCYHHHDRVHTHSSASCLSPGASHSPSPYPPLLRGRSGRVLDMVATTPRMVATEHHLHSIIDRRRDGGGARLPRAPHPHTLAHASTHSLGFGFNTSRSLKRDCFASSRASRLAPENPAHYSGGASQLNPHAPPGLPEGHTPSEGDVGTLRVCSVMPPTSTTITTRRPQPHGSWWTVILPPIPRREHRRRTTHHPERPLLPPPGWRPPRERADNGASRAALTISPRPGASPESGGVVPGRPSRRYLRVAKLVLSTQPSQEPRGRRAGPRLVHQLPVAAPLPAGGGRPHRDVRFGLPGPSAILFALRYSPVYHVYDPNFIDTFHELLSRKCPARLLLVPAARRGEPPAAPRPHPAGRRQHASTYRPRRPSAGTGLIALGTSFSIPAWGRRAAARSQLVTCHMPRLPAAEDTRSHRMPRLGPPRLDRAPPPARQD